MSECPFFSVVVPVYDTEITHLRECLESVLNQSCADWQLILANNGSKSPAVARTLNEYAESDSRISVISIQENVGISDATNRAANQANGKYLVFLDSDDLLTSDALECVGEFLQQNPNVDYVYSDEDKLAPDGSLVEPFFKPDWSPERLLGQMYTCHLSVLLRELFEELGGLRSEFDGSQDHDLILRVMNVTKRIGHIAKILYHWRISPTSTASGSGVRPETHERGRRAVEESLLSQGVYADVLDIGVPNSFRIRRHGPVTRPRVSLLIPTYGMRVSDRNGGTTSLLRSFIASIEAKSTYVDFEYVISFDHSNAQEAVAESLPLMSRPATLIPYREGPAGFNFSHKVNEMASSAQGEVLIIPQAFVSMAVTLTRVRS